MDRNRIFSLRIIWYTLPVLVALFLFSFKAGEGLAHHISGGEYNVKGHLTSDGNINRCHEGGYSSEAQYASGTWSYVTTNRLNMYYNCSGVELRTKAVDLGVANPLGYVVICPPAPNPCLNAYTGAGSNADLDTV